MPQLSMLPQCNVLLAMATQTQSGTSANLTLPFASSYRLFLNCQTVTGTSPTLDLFVATAFDATGAAGTNYFTFLKFAQVTSSGLGRMITIRPYLGPGDTATESQAALVGTADGATGSTPVVNNGPFNPAAIKLRWVVAGTSPSVSFSVGYICVTQDLSD